MKVTMLPRDHWQVGPETTDLVVIVSGEAGPRPRWLRVSNAAIEALETAAFAYPGVFEAVLSDGFVRNLSCLSVGKMDCEPR